MAIRTPDQRVRVFLSSTMRELATERQAVREAIESLHMTPVMFELGARPHPPRALYRAYLEQSDIFIGLYWESYGWVAPGEDISGLEDEYRLSGNRPKLIYVKTPAPSRHPRLTDLIATIQHDDQASYRSFGDPDELRTLVAEDLAVLLAEHFWASAEAATGPSTSAAVLSLPRPPTQLIGREADVARVLDILAEPDARMITIVGAGGIGKSRLAVAVAERAGDRYRDGIAYVELATVTEPSLVLPTVAKALGIEERNGGDVSARLRERLGGAQLLIVLDNMEQLAGAADELSDLLSKTRDLQLLVTSRRILDVLGERVYTLEPLEVPEDGATTAAVELFLERARAIHPGYQPSDADLVAFAELSRRLDGLPLAIELAAARLRILSPPALLQRMGYQRLDFLSRGAQDLPSRQRTLRDAVDWSFSLLSADSQLLFARLSVFVGSADLEAIEQVTNPDGQLDTLDVIADLVDQSLVQALAEAAEPRFAMLETIREYAVERLEATGTAAEYRARHEAYYLELAERGNVALSTAEQLEWMDRLARENDNFRAVLRRALRRNDAATALRMGRALTSYWYIGGSHSEGRGWMDQIVALPNVRPEERAAARTIGAIQAFLQGDYGPIETGLDDAVAVAGEAEDRRTFALARLLQAIARADAGLDEGDWQTAVGEASRRLEDEGEPLAVAFGLVTEAVLARIHGHLDEARRLAQDAYDLSSKIGEFYVRMNASTQLARTYRELRDTAAAHRAAVETLLIARRLRNVTSESYALELWAAAELREGQVERAGRLYALAERAYRQVGSGLWRHDAERHRELEAELRTTLGDRYEQLLTEAQTGDLDQMVNELVQSEPRQPSSVASDATQPDQRRTSTASTAPRTAKRG